MRRLPGAVAMGALVCALVAAGALTAEQPHVVIRDGDGRELTRVALEDSTFALGYRNSLYDAWVEERFMVAPEGRFRLEAVASESVAVIEEYYGLTPEPVDVGSAIASRGRLAQPPAFTELRVLATAVGNRTLLVGARRVELAPLAGDGRVVHLSLR